MTLVFMEINKIPTMYIWIHMFKTRVNYKFRSCVYTITMDTVLYFQKEAFLNQDSGEKNQTNYE